MLRHIHNLKIAIASLLTNKMKSFLTALGIIFGVAAVISMLAIGNGARQEILNQIKLVGVNNIVIAPIIDEDKTIDDSQKSKEKFSRGLTIADVDAIKTTIPSVNLVSPQIVEDTYLISSGKRKETKLLGVSNDFFSIFNVKLSDGSFFKTEHELEGLPVCIISNDVKIKIFNNQNPVNQYLKSGNVWLKVIGVIEKKNVSIATPEKLGIVTSDFLVYIPVKTMLLRYTNRALINTKTFTQNTEDNENQTNKKKKNTNQLDRIIVQVKQSEQITLTRQILSRMLLRRHSGKQDFEIIVPEQLLKQQQKAKDIFNIVLGAIAGISLLVGGIGIMNIMLASVLERITEIGIRMAVGARRRDISFQFLAESVLISVSGGFTGILLGVLFSKIIMKTTGILTIISPSSVFISFSVSVAIGIAFGYLPAKRASNQDPVVSLRYSV